MKTRQVTYTIRSHEKRERWLAKASEKTRLLRRGKRTGSVQGITVLSRDDIINPGT